MAARSLPRLYQLLFSLPPSSGRRVAGAAILAVTVASATLSTSAHTEGAHAPSSSDSPRTDVPPGSAASTASSAVGGGPRPPPARMGPLDARRHLRPLLDVARVLFNLPLDPGGDAEDAMAPYVPRVFVGLGGPGSSAEYEVIVTARIDARAMAELGGAVGSVGVAAEHADLISRVLTARYVMHADANSYGANSGGGGGVGSATPGIDQVIFLHGDSSDVEVRLSGTGSTAQRGNGAVSRPSTDVTVIWRPRQRVRHAAPAPHSGSVVKGDGSTPAVEPGSSPSPSVVPTARECGLSWMDIDAIARVFSVGAACACLARIRADEEAINAAAATAAAAAGGVVQGGHVAPVPATVQRNLDSLGKAHALMGRALNETAALRMMASQLQATFSMQHQQQQQQQADGSGAAPTGVLQRNGGAGVSAGPNSGSGSSTPSTIGGGGGYITSGAANGGEGLDYADSSPQGVFLPSCVVEILRLGGLLGQGKYLSLPDAGVDTDAGGTGGRPAHRTGSVSSGGSGSGGGVIGGSARRAPLRHGPPGRDAAAAGGAASSSPAGVESVPDPLATLASMGVTVYTRDSHDHDTVSWAGLAGCDAIRQETEDGILFPLEHPEIYSGVATLTRVTPEGNHGGAYLFEGPPGTGKTTTARIIAKEVHRPLVVLNFEDIGSAYFSQSEGNLGKVLDAVKAIPGAILFIDEAESLFPSRYSSDMHGSATSSIGNKMLAQMLKFIEGVSGASHNTVILASNRASELDPALLSRCAAAVQFRLPDADQRAAIWGRYAKQLVKEGGALGALVEASEGMSGRDIKRVCEVAERRHAASLQRAKKAHPEPSTGNGAEGATVEGGAGVGGTAQTAPPSSPWAITAPGVEEYLSAAAERSEGALGGPADPQHPHPFDGGFGGGRRRRRVVRGEGGRGRGGGAVATAHGVSCGAGRSKCTSEPGLRQVLV